ncbi:MAG: hypothetical protein M1587_06820 [Thaumarchaeota archaeon]|nr:hypothetical protein [Nitrososphaerota archaeon]
MKISERGIAEGKRPPLCDGCGEPIQKNEEEGYMINCLILDGEIFHSIQCDECIERYFRALPRFKEDEVPKEARQTVRLVMSQDMEVYVP